MTFDEKSHGKLDASSALRVAERFSAEHYAPIAPLHALLIAQEIEDEKGSGDPSGIRTLYPGIMKTSIAARPCADLRVILGSSNIPRGTVLDRGDPSRSLPSWQRRGKKAHGPIARLAYGRVLAAAIRAVRPPEIEDGGDAYGLTIKQAARINATR